MSPANSRQITLCSFLKAWFHMGFPWECPSNGRLLSVSFAIQILAFLKIYKISFIRNRTLLKLSRQEIINELIKKAKFIGEYDEKILNICVCRTLCSFEVNAEVEIYSYVNSVTWRVSSHARQWWRIRSVTASLLLSSSMPSLTESPNHCSTDLDLLWSQPLHIQYYPINF